MPKTIRFHLDENGPDAVARGLRRFGVDVTTTLDAGLGGAIDQDHLAYANQHQRMIFTQDEDFLVLHAKGVPHAGIAYCQQHTRTIGEIIQGLKLIWEIYEPVEMMNQVEYL